MYSHVVVLFFFFFSSRRRHTRFDCDWSSDVCSSDLTVSGGTFNYNAGTVGGAGTVNLSSTTANFTPDFSNATTALRLINTTLNGPGRLINAAGRAISRANVRTTSPLILPTPVVC